MKREQGATSCLLLRSLVHLTPGEGQSTALHCKHTVQEVGFAQVQHGRYSTTATRGRQSQAKQRISHR